MPRILLIDDERDTRELLARALERNGYECEVIGTASEAHQRLDTAGTHFNAIVTDVVLGNDDRGGLHILRAIKQRELPAPVVLITAFADVEKVKFALNEGAAYLLEKPFKAAELISAIDRVLGPKEGPDAFEHIFERVQLTEKERVVARHLLAGLTSNEIAHMESNSPKTIRQHVSQIYAKCCVSNRAEFLRLVYAK
ncbi:MAG TPA: response regulator transcription factor [Polyangiales bacterium]|nr:response regulator transcription factor [Polyangiales bacterium]